MHPTQSAQEVGGTAGCGEYVNLERRRAMSSLGRAMRGASRGRRAMAAGAAALGTIQSATFARGGSASARDVIVYEMLRGGADALTICPPHADPDYASMRGNLAVPPPGQLGGALDLDGYFGLSPAMAALMPAYQAGDLTLIQGAGSTDPTRSHFDAMLFIEGGIPGFGTNLVTSGWLGRHVASMPQLDPAATLRAMSIDSVTPVTLVGSPKMLAISDPSNFNFAGWPSSSATRKALLSDLYERQEPVLADAAEATIQTIDRLGAIDFDAAPGGGAVYPDSKFGDGLRRTAAIIRADIGLEAIQVDRGGWDHHDDMGPNDGELFGMLEELSQSLAAFRTDLGSLMGSVTVVVQSEFGRRVDANGSGGVDHGRGGCMMVLGGNVNGGQVLRHNWQGLDPANLDDLALPVTIDYRDLLIEVLAKRGGNASASTIFEAHTPFDWGVVN